MERIAGDTVSQDLFGSGKHGFSAGSPSQQIPATIVTAAFLNGVQEELANAIGLVSDVVPAQRDQLARALSTLAELRAIGAFFPRPATYAPVSVRDAAASTDGACVVAVGDVVSVDSAPRTCWVSADGGRSFTAHGAAVSSGYSNGARLVAVAFNDAYNFVAVGGMSDIEGDNPNDAAILHGSIGSYGALASLVRRTAAAASTPSGLFASVRWASALGLFVIAGRTGGEVQTSPDGVTWTRRIVGAETGAVTVSVDGTRLFAVAGPRIYVSNDAGATWTQATVNNPPAAQGNFQPYLTPPEKMPNGSYLSTTNAAGSADVAGSGVYAWRGAADGLTFTRITLPIGAAPNPFRVDARTGMLTTSRGAAGFGQAVFSLPSGDAYRSLAVLGAPLGVTSVFRSRSKWFGIGGANNALFVSPYIAL